MVQKKNKNKNRKRKTRQNLMNASTAQTNMNAPVGRIAAPVATTRVRRVRQPKVQHMGGKGDVVVEHEEFLQDVPGSVAFANTTIAINPGLPNCFPWLSQMAPLYESYRFEKLRFDFQTEAATTATGTLMLAVDYDASDSAATSKQQLANYRGFVRAAPWSSCSNVSLSEDLNKRKSYYVRSGNLAANQDVKLYDVGFLNVATNGQASAATIGELYVRYRVRFMTPQLQQSGLGNSQWARYSGTTLAGAITATGNAPLSGAGTPEDLQLTSTQPYQALVSLVATGVGISALSTATSTATITALSSFPDSTGANFAANFAVNFTAPGQTLRLDLTATSVSAYNVRLAQYQYSLG